MNELKEIAVALGLDENADLAAVKAKIKEITDSVAAMNKAKLEGEADAFCNSNKDRIQDVAAVRGLYMRDPETAKAWMNSLRKPAAPAAPPPPVSATVPAQTPAGQQLPDGAFRDESGKVWANRLVYHNTLTGSARKKHLREHRDDLLALERKAQK